MRNALGQFVIGHKTFPKERLNGRFAKKVRKERNKVLCKIDGCMRVDIAAHGMCSKHYLKMYYRKKNGLPHDDISLSSNIAKTGENNPGWIDGRAKKPYGVEFTHKLKEKIRNRDGRKCAECGCPEKELNRKLCVHHIDSNKGNNTDINLISLCQTCHHKVHWSDSEWGDYFRNIILGKIWDYKNY